MADLSDIFSTSNLNQLANNPLLAIGAQLMAQGRQGSSSQALGQGLSGGLQTVQQSQHNQQLADFRTSQIELQKQQQAAANAKAQQAQQFKANLNNPEFLKTLPPEVQGWVQAGASPDQVMDLVGKHQSIEQQQARLDQQNELAQLRLQQQGSSQAQQADMQQLRLQQAQAQFDQRQNRQPTKSQTVDMPLADGTFQRQIWDDKSNGYVPYGQPYRKADNGLAALFGGGPAVPDSGAPANPAVDKVVNQVAPMAAAGGGTANVPKTNAAAQVPGQPAQVKTAEDFDKLPSGAMFITPDGKLKQKP